MDKIPFDFTCHVKNIEEAQSIENLQVETPLSDEELEKNGLIKTTAFIRTKKSKNALRVEKNKKRKAAKGIKQLNIEVHEDNKELIKNLNKIISKQGFVSTLVKFIAKHF